MSRPVIECRAEDELLVFRHRANNCVRETGIRLACSNGQQGTHDCFQGTVASTSASVSRGSGVLSFQ